jgi:hypothetical protein
MATMRRLVREPLFRFLALGAVIFVVYGLRTGNKVPKPAEIVVTQGAIENLVTGFTRTWQRPPNEQELQGLLRDYIRQEAAYREAVVLGLDRDDLVVRRRLQQKLEFLSTELTERAEPSDADLQEFMLTHVEMFKSEPRFSFRQIYFNPQSRGANAHRDAARVRDKLQTADQRSNAANVGDPFLLEQAFDDVSLSDVKKTFGERFASDLANVRLGTWQGPVDSGYGTHLVFLNQRSEGHIPSLAEARDQVRREWIDARRREATDKFYQALLSRLTIRIEPLPEPKVAQVH